MNLGYANPSLGKTLQCTVFPCCPQSGILLCSFGYPANKTWIILQWGYPLVPLNQFVNPDDADRTICI